MHWNAIYMQAPIQQLRRNGLEVRDEDISHLSPLIWRGHDKPWFGFRVSALSMLNESGLWNADAIERLLAHVDGDGVRRASARAVQ